MLYLEARYGWYSSRGSVGIHPFLDLYQSPVEGHEVHQPQLCIQHQAVGPVVKYLRVQLHDLNRWEEDDDGPVKCALAPQKASCILGFMRRSMANRSRKGHKK